MFLLRKKMLTQSFLVAHPSWVVVFMVFILMYMEYALPVGSNQPELPCIPRWQ